MDKTVVSAAQKEKRQNRKHIAKSKIWR